MNNFFKENHDLVFLEWISPTEVKDATVLDLGSQTGWLGEYCMRHGAKNYVGVEIDEFHIIDSRKHYPNLTFYHMDLEEYLEICVRDNIHYDIVVISRTIQGVHNQTTVIQNLAKIADKVVLETGVPVNLAAQRLLKILNSLELTDNHKREIDEINKFIEYQQPFIEYFVDEQFIHVVPSTGFFTEVFAKLGFELCLETYEHVKEKYPNEYGYEFKNLERDLIKKSILKFKKVSDIKKPITWKEWDDIKDL